MQLIKTFIFSTFFSTMSIFSQSKQKVLVCYGKFDVDLVKGYDLIIMESAQFNVYEVAKIKKNNKKVVAYISLGETTEISDDFKSLKSSTLGKNKDWNSYYLDLSLEKTRKSLDRTIGRYFFMGYDGLFLDNIDNFNSYGPQFSYQKYLVDYIKNIRLKYPKSYIVQNAGMELISATRSFVDCMLIESVASNFTFEDKKYKLRAKLDYDQYMENIKKMNNTHKIPIILVEYADTKVLANNIAERLKNTPYSYFIGDLSLQTLPKFK
jgi:polysaccharide biosynthesis protein PelA